MSENLLTFISTFPYLSSIEDCTPKKMIKATPEWWKKTTIDESVFPENSGNVKHCPSFPDYFSQGYYLPMWVDTVLEYKKDSGDWTWAVSKKGFSWEVHHSNQFVDFAEPLVNGKSGYAVFKAISPWSIFTPPGYSVLQLPMFYQFNKDFTVLPGIFASDVEHTLNIQVLLHSDSQKVVIERGTPLVQYIPFKRSDKIDMTYRDATEEDLEKINISKINYTTKFSQVKEYLSLRKKVDEEISKYE